MVGKKQLTRLFTLDVYQVSVSHWFTGIGLAALYSLAVMHELCPTPLHNVFKSHPREGRGFYFGVDMVCC